jgi:hypothetical protein
MTHLRDEAAIERASPALPIARNTALLSAALGTHAAMLSLTAAGVAALAIGAMALLVAPAVWIRATAKRTRLPRGGDHDG